MTRRKQGEGTDLGVETTIEGREAALRVIARDLHWMARRWADGRMSVAPSLVNDHTRSLLALGVELTPDNGLIFARDGMGRDYDGLTEEEATPVIAEPPITITKRTSLACLSRQVEDRARLLWADKRAGISRTWDSMSEARRQYWREQARRQVLQDEGKE